MKKIEVVSESVETQFEAVIENEDAGDRTAADYADAEPTNDEAYD
jgi:hypothetical protein